MLFIRSIMSFHTRAPQSSMQLDKGQAPRQMLIPPFDKLRLDHYHIPQSSIIQSVSVNTQQYINKQASRESLSQHAHANHGHFLSHQDLKQAHQRQESQTGEYKTATYPLARPSQVVLFPPTTTSNVHVPIESAFSNNTISLSSLLRGTRCLHIGHVHWVAPRRFPCRRRIALESTNKQGRRSEAHLQERPTNQFFECPVLEMQHNYSKYVDERSIWNPFHLSSKSLLRPLGQRSSGHSFVQPQIKARIGSSQAPAIAPERSLFGKP